MSASVSQQTASVRAKLDQVVRRKLDASRAALDAWGAGAEESMRQNAAWQNHTGQARWGATDANPIYAQQPLTISGQGLHTTPLHPQDVRDGSAVALGGDAPYTTYLEANPQYEIILRTIASAQPQLTDALERIW